MTPRRKKRLTIILAISLGLATVIGLVLYALSPVSYTHLTLPTIYSV